MLSIVVYKLKTVNTLQHILTIVL